MIYCIMGQSGAGKTTITQCLLRQPNLDLTPLILLTTRPKRESEVDGEEYYFINTNLYKSMLNSNHIICHQSYIMDGKKEPYYWGVLNEHIYSGEGDYIVPASLTLFEMLANQYSYAIPIILTVPATVRKQRMIDHGDYESEIDRRLIEEKRIPIHKVHPQFKINNTQPQSAVVGAITNAIINFKIEKGTDRIWQLNKNQYALTPETMNSNIFNLLN